MFLCLYTIWLHSLKIGHVFIPWIKSVKVKFGVTVRMVTRVIYHAIHLLTQNLLLLILAPPIFTRVIICIKVGVGYLCGACGESCYIIV